MCVSFVDRLLCVVCCVCVCFVLFIARCLSFDVCSVLRVVRCALRDMY